MKTLTRCWPIGKLDVIDICLPPAAHADVATRALKADKHVFCEKPIALAPADAVRMVKTAKSRGKQLMIGQVLPFFPEYAFAYQAVTSGKYGRLLGGHFKRIISDPPWLDGLLRSPEGRRADARLARTRCPLHSPAVRHAPKGLQRGRMRGEVAEYFVSQFAFDDPKLVVSAASGVIHQQGRPFSAGFEIHLERATLVYDNAGIVGHAGEGVPLSVLTADGKVQRPKLGSSDPVDSFVAELTEAARTVKSGKPSALLDGGLARDAVVLCQKQTESIRKRRPVAI